MIMKFRIVFVDDKKSVYLTHVISICCALLYFATGIYLLPKECPLTFNISSYDGTGISEFFLCVCLYF